MTTSITRTDRAKALGGHLLQGGTVVALIVLIVFFFLMRPNVFLTFVNIRNILFQVSILAIISAAQTVAMVVGDFDLSVGATSSLSGAVTASLMLGGTSIPLAILVGLAVGTGVGIFNGYLVAYVKVSAFVATLASMTSVIGLSYLVTGGTTLFRLPPTFQAIGQGRLLGVPLPVYFAIAVGLITWFVLRYTTTGRRWYAIGGNHEVSRLSGVNVNRSRFLAFVVAGLISGIGGILLAARLGSASAVQDGNNMMFAVAAVFLGMTVAKSGAANILGTMIGVMIIGVLANGLNILGVNAYVQQVITGLIIVAAVVLSSLRNRER